jgi:hypothetical protein
MDKEELDDFINSAPWYCNDCKANMISSNPELMQSESMNEPIRISMEHSD